jgi:hypothetical protein
VAFLSLHVLLVEMFSLSTDATNPSLASIVLRTERQARSQGAAFAHVQSVDRSWPADHAAIGAAKRFVAAASTRVVVASHNDVDGLSAAIIMTRALAAA